MSKYCFIIALSVLMSFLACNQQAKKSQSFTPPTTEDLIFPLNIQKGGTFTSLEQIRAQARTIIDHRIEQEPEALAMLTSTHWWPEYVFNAGSISKEGHYDGYWLRFDEDFKYQYGQYQHLFGEGKYHFNLDSKSLIMLDSDVDSEPKVWTANYNGQAIALVGTHEYGVNNGMQIKLVSIDEQPQQ